METYFVPHFDMIKHVADKHFESVPDKLQFLDHCEKCYSQLLAKANSLIATGIPIGSSRGINILYNTYCVITGYQPPEIERGDEPPDIFWNDEEERDEFPLLVNPARMKNEREMVRAEIEFWNRQLGRQIKGHEATAEVPGVAASVLSAPEEPTIFPAPVGWTRGAECWQKTVKSLKEHGLVTFPANGTWTDAKKKPRIHKLPGHVAALFENLSMEFPGNCGADYFLEKSFLYKGKKPNKHNISKLKLDTRNMKNGKPEFEIMLEEINLGLTVNK